MDARQLRSLLSEVAEELRRQGVTARLYVVGGAAMVLAHNSQRTTRDVDALVLDGHGPVMDAARLIASRHGLPGSWLNEQATSYIPRTDDARPVVVFDHPALRVLAASAEHLLVMKSVAARATDIDDIVRLAALTGIASLAALEELVERVLPDEPLSDRSRAVLRELFGP